MAMPGQGGTGNGARGGVGVALQGGGAHGAFTWGVLDRLLEDGLTVGRVCGVSSGAIIGTMLVQGLVRGGRAGAREAIRQFWHRVGQANALNPLASNPVERWLWGWDRSNNLAWQSLEAAMRLFSPAQLNPFGHNPLRAVIAELLDQEALTHPAAPSLIVAATDVQTGSAAFFGNAEITVDVLLASACLPFVFPAVEIGGRTYWDGGYVGNPPLAPLLGPPLPEEIILVRAQPLRRARVPATHTEILNRLHEIACNAVLEAELAALPATVRVTGYDADAVLGTLPISSKLSADTDFLLELFEAGRGAARGLPAAAD